MERVWAAAPRLEGQLVLSLTPFPVCREHQEEISNLDQA